MLQYLSPWSRQFFFYTGTTLSNPKPKQESEKQRQSYRYLHRLSSPSNLSKNKTRENTQIFFKKLTNISIKIRRSSSKNLPISPSKYADLLQKNLPISPSAVGPALVQVKLPPSSVSLMENDADIRLGLLRRTPQHPNTSRYTPIQPHTATRHERGEREHTTGSKEIIRGRGGGEGESDRYMHSNRERQREKGKCTNIIGSTTTAG